MPKWWERQVTVSPSFITPLVTPPLARLAHRRGMGVNRQRQIKAIADPWQSAALVAGSAARVMEMRGRSMPGWLNVSSDDLRTDDDIAAWGDRGTGYARLLPPKQ